MMYSFQFALSFSLLVLIICSTVNAKVVWQPFYRKGKVIDQTPWFSEEDDGHSGNRLSPIFAMECYGHYCDGKRLFTARDGANPAAQGTYHSTEWFSEDAPLPKRADCPLDMVVYDIYCRGPFCDDMKLLCGRVTSGYRVVSSEKKLLSWFPWYSGKIERRECPNGYYISGMACHGHYCGTLQIMCVRIDYGVATNYWKLLIRDGSYLVYSDVFNERENGYSGRMTGTIAGIQCIGKYCGSKRLIAVLRHPISYIVEGTSYWTDWISDTYARCPNDMVVNEIQCKGTYCGEMRLQCGKVKLGYVIKNGYKEKFMNYYEKGTRFCPNGYYVAGIKCGGQYCQRIRLTCVAIEFD